LQPVNAGESFLFPNLKKIFDAGRKRGEGGAKQGRQAGKTLKEVFKQKRLFVNNFLNMANFCW